MYINGSKVKELREEIGLCRSELADYLALDVVLLRRYEEGMEDWYEEDAFRLMTLEELMPEYDFFLNIEYLDMLEELSKEYD